ncbi:MAG TPA: DUF1731 domain-containing protein [Chitinophagaceae bacterium]|nr:DUF1731 domain-containing protein [Chitinophagaceae bacterium]
MQALRQACGRRWGVPAPAALLELGAWLLGTEAELVLKSRWVYPERALAEGFRFQFPDLESALADLTR